ncbi:3-deoxy-manno-octulosonate cytidylyltransferase [Inmirania thermothiophila]|uniref:3-deoxy-manno-octulosonate cytidylyltransferase n=1 Tax=Inmirania thermothiophila TaxID=1750597 RepID=A0A3N1Y1F1_9GAMM|nr:3-deoxy-manno-octulosonate cytidylyltransferase [Inmirania thermothiophila]ROR32649.1 3-deoxy-manno-octulosonate cytidylyltransferase (CMP-KDO synthetase) [Inmirania thermothiophila]
MTAFVVVIPARHGASRLPGKPLRPLAGRPLIAHVCERALASGAAQVLVATDDERIAACARAAGAEAVMTSPAHRSGTERIAEVAERLGWDEGRIVVNLQGDEPLVPPQLAAEAAALLARSGAAVATLAAPLETPAALFDPNVVKVVCDAAGRALYFSRAPVPWAREAFAGGAPPALPPAGAWLRHIGIYAYRAGFLRRYAGLPPSPLEAVEALEQLRVLWHGEAIAVGITAHRPGPGIDTEADLAAAEAMLREGGRRGANGGDSG